MVKNNKNKNTTLVIRNIRNELRENIDGGFNPQRFYKEHIRYYGVRTPIVRRIAKKYFKLLKEFDKKTIFYICEKLFSSDYNEECIIAIQFINGIINKLESGDFVLLENWLNKHINNWSKDDDFCLHILNPMIKKYPKIIRKIKLWTLSKNKWVRRASAVSFIESEGSYYTIDSNRLKTIFYIAKKLFNDREDLVQKGYGWMLKAASIKNQNGIINFVTKNKEKMSRTALRCAIEKMPKEVRKRLLLKER